MPWYNDLRPPEDQKKQDFALVFPDMKASEKTDTIEDLLRLRQYLDFNVSPKYADKNLLIASWNIKEFGKLSKRLPASYFFIAEILNRFDLIAVQEIKHSLSDLFIIMRLLGSDWDYLINDMTEGRAGNSERFAYIYNTKRVSFSGLAGEIVLWEELINSGGIKQLKRTPYITGFKAGWKSFAIISVHLQPSNDDEDKAFRKQEIQALVNAIKAKIEKRSLWTNNLLLVGDFNIYADNDDMMKILASEGFKEIPGLAELPTNVSQTEAYDKIMFRENPFFNLSTLGGRSAGVLKFFESVYRTDHFQRYKKQMRDHKEDPTTLKKNSDYEKYFNQYWKRNQMSDHYPIWIEIDIDSSDSFLADKLEQWES